jgi:hypothetical protein
MKRPRRDVKVCPGLNLLRRTTSIKRFERRQEGDVAVQTDASHPTQHGLGREVPAEALGRADPAMQGTT